MSLSDLTDLDNFHETLMAQQWAGNLSPPTQPTGGSTGSYSMSVFKPGQFGTTVIPSVPTVLPSGLFPQFVRPEITALGICGAAATIALAYSSVTFGWLASIPLVGTLVGSVLAIVSIVKLARTL